MKWFHELLSDAFVARSKQCNHNVLQKSCDDISKVWSYDTPTSKCIFMHIRKVIVHHLILIFEIIFPASFFFQATVCRRSDLLGFPLSLER